MHAVNNFILLLYKIIDNINAKAIIDYVKITELHTHFTYSESIKFWSSIIKNNIVYFFYYNYFFYYFTIII